MDLQVDPGWAWSGPSPIGPAVVYTRSSKLVRVLPSPTAFFFTSPPAPLVFALKQPAPFASKQVFCIVVNIITGSDYETLFTTIPKRGFSAPERVRYKVPLDHIPGFYGLVKAGAQFLPSVNAREVRISVELDLRIEKLNKLFDTVFKTASRLTQDGSDNVSWWTECAMACNIYLKADRGNL